MAIFAGTNISKFNGYAVLGILPGVDITKFAGYAVLGDTNVIPPLWGAWTFPDGTQYISYDYSWDMSTSATVVSYSVVAGAIPTGLSLTALTGNQAHIHGVPLALGLFNFTLRATNAFGTVDKAFSITINPIPSSAGGNFGFVA
jgi:hypothetical protein